MSDRDARLRAGILAIWQKSLPRVREQLDTLERAAAALLTGRLDVVLAREAEREAHRLAGAAGSFGFHAASPLARELEEIFGGRAPGEARHVGEVVARLRAVIDLDAPPAQNHEAAEQEPRPAVLVVDDDEPLCAAVVAAFRERGYDGVAVATLEAARAAIEKTDLAAILLDIRLEGENGLDLLDDVSRAGLTVPVIMLTAHGEFTDRVGAMRKGARGFLQKPLAPADVAACTIEMIEHAQSETPRVLAVDDDAAVLTLLRAMLKRAGLAVTTVNDPREFWQTIRETRPDVVLLDYDMPHHNGLELCRVMRNDPVWRAVPVIFITARTDTTTITSLFDAGADDYIAKPVVNAEVIARVKNRVERTRLLRQVAETDYLTGLSNRAKSEESLRYYAKLSERYKQPLSVALIDLDSFEQVNREYGVAVGDDVLRAFAMMLRSTFRGEDVIARWSGARFMVGMYGMASSDAVHRLGELLETVQQKPLDVSDGVQVTVHFSVGIAQFGADGADVDAVTQKAQEALHSARASGRAPVQRAGGENAL